MAVYRPKYRDPKTGELKEQAVWWYEFTFAGQRVRESSESTRKTIAIEAEKNHRLRLERANAGMPTEQREQRIKTAAEVLKTYEQQYKINHRANSVVVVTERWKHLTRLLANVLLPDLTPDRITAYMEDRLKEGAGNRTINLELMVLSLGRSATHGRRSGPRVKKLEETTTPGARWKQTKKSGCSMLRPVIPRISSTRF
jgi:hypothetical protein